MRYGHVSWDKKAFWDCIAIRCIDYERTPQTLAQRCDYQVKCIIYTSDITLESARVLILFRILGGKQNFIHAYCSRMINLHYYQYTTKTRTPFL
jgi:hypothetical protein